MARGGGERKIGRGVMAIGAQGPFQTAARREAKNRPGEGKLGMSP